MLEVEREIRRERLELQEQTIKLERKIEELQEFVTFLHQRKT